MSSVIVPRASKKSQEFDKTVRKEGKNPIKIDAQFFSSTFPQLAPQPYSNLHQALEYQV